MCGCSHHDGMQQHLRPSPVTNEGERTPRIHIGLWVTLGSGCSAQRVQHLGAARPGGDTRSIPGLCVLLCQHCGEAAGNGRDDEGSGTRRAVESTTSCRALQPRETWRGGSEPGRAGCPGTPQPSLCQECQSCSDRLIKCTAEMQPRSCSMGSWNQAKPDLKSPA